MGKNKVKYGLRNVHYAVVTESPGGVVSYGTPKHVPGAVNLTLDAAGEEVAFYADDGLYFEENTNNGYTGSLEMALIPDEFRVDILGDEIDENGALIENRDAQVKKMALMFEFDGDANKTRHVMYSVLPTRPSVSGATRTNTKEPQTESMDIAARPALDTGDVKAKVKQGESPYDNFYSAVYLKSAPVNTVEEAAVEFSKSEHDDVTVNVTSTDAQNAVKNVLLDGVPIPGVYLTPAGVDVTIGQTYLSALDNGDYTITVEFMRGNAVTVALTVTA